MKKGDPGYDQYGGGKEFWVSYHSRYRDEFNGLLRSRRRSRRARTNDNNSKK